MDNIQDKKEPAMKCHTCSTKINTSAPGGHNGFSNGHAVDSDGNPICYPCCAEADRDYMSKHGCINLYLSMEDGRWIVSNRPGSLKFTNLIVTTGCHNIADIRHDAWFIFSGRAWHGVQLGHNSDVIRCKALQLASRTESKTFWKLYHSM